MIFQQPNVFGILENAPELAAAAKDAGALAIAHVDPVSLGVLEAPGNYGADSHRRGPERGNYQSYAGPHYGFLASKASTRGGCPAGSSARRPTSTATAATC